MSDLISRSVLIKVLKDRATNEAIMGYMTAYDVTNSIIDEVEEQPTAYDIDEVVEKLEIERKTANNTYNSFNMGVDLGRVFSLEKAIEIVKQGGVGAETETIRDKAVKWNNNSSKRVPYEFIDYVEGKRDIEEAEDCCEWISASDGEFIQNPHTKRLYSNEPSMQNVYCNTCGKKIKIVGD